MIEGRDFAAASTVGARERQEDDWGTHAHPPALEPRARLLAVVADGMGGMPGGAQASELAVRAFLDSYLSIARPARERLRHALAHANREVGIAVEGGQAPDGMGCTLVAALFFLDRCEWLSVGDSSVLHCRGEKLQRANPLHVFADALDEQVRREEISAEEAEDHPDRHALTSAVQGTVMEEVAQGELSLVSGDVVLLATDGVSTLSTTEIASVCAEHGPGGAGSIAETLIARTEAKGRANQDNATVVAVRHTSEDLVHDYIGAAAEADTDARRGAHTGGSDERVVANSTEPTDDSLQPETVGEAAPTEAQHGDDETGTAQTSPPRRLLESTWARYAAAFLLGAFSSAAVYTVLF